MEAGQTILSGKYSVISLTGEGGMACVWLAEELTFGRRRVAIKEPRTDLPSGLAQEVEDRYRREVQVCAALEQAGVPNIVRALTAEPHDEGLLLVMEYMPGGDLAALLREHPGGMPVEQALSITLDLLRALEGVHAHELEVVHRDIKPSNVLLDERGAAHLADFGLAQLAGVSGRSQLTGGQHPGTPMYMAPEQETSTQMLTPAADIFALGCVLFETLTGQRYKRYEPGTRPSALRPEVPDWLDAMVDKALQEDPWQRWRGAGEMIPAMEAPGSDAILPTVPWQRLRESSGTHLGATENAGALARPEQGISPLESDPGARHSAGLTSRAMKAESPRLVEEASDRAKGSVMRLAAGWILLLILLVIAILAIASIVLENATLPWMSM